MKEFLLNKYALMQFESDDTVLEVETRGLLPPKEKSKFDYELTFMIGIKYSNSKSAEKRNMACNTITILNTDTLFFIYV
jgi:hypothetical protein